MAMLPENSSLCPDRRFPLMNFVSDISTELSNVLFIACSPSTSLASPNVILSSISGFSIDLMATFSFSVSAFPVIRMYSCERAPLFGPIRA